MSSAGAPVSVPLPVEQSASVPAVVAGTLAAPREPWGALFFVIKDPDDNLIGFGEAASKP